MNEAEAIEIAENEIITLKRYLKEASMVMHWDRFKKMIEALTLAIQSLKQKPRLSESKILEKILLLFHWDKEDNLMKAKTLAKSLAEGDVCE